MSLLWIRYRTCTMMISYSNTIIAGRRSFLWFCACFLSSTNSLWQLSCLSFGCFQLFWWITIAHKKSTRLTREVMSSIIHPEIRFYENQSTSHSGGCRWLQWLIWDFDGEDPISNSFLFFGLCIFWPITWTLFSACFNWHWKNFEFCFWFLFSGQSLFCMLQPTLDEKFWPIFDL